QPPATSPPAPPAAAPATKLPLDLIKLPPGFHIDVFAENVDNPRSMTRSPEGTLYVGTRDAGNVYALRDTNHDNRADLVFIIARDLNMPNGVAFRDGSLYVAEINRVLRYDNIEQYVSAMVQARDRPIRMAQPTAIVVYDGYPTDEHHGWKYIAFGPDGKLYVPVGAPCNICEPENPIYCTITRLDVRTPGAQPEIVQRGIRNTVGFTWHPETKDLWFTDNGRDWLGDDLPPCELNHATADGQHFGYPYCHGGTIPDPNFGSKRNCSEFVAPAQNLGPHVAPLGVEFYTGKMFPKTYKNQAFIAEHGSWNRATKTGYRVSLVKLDAKGNSLGYETFAEGWLQPEEKIWGRPVDIELLPDGSMLVSDDFANAIYRIYYKG
ncbi:MAG TPA: PQQ-dependent sugar dehydrogenase, partial [Saprospiraceae bacterium]|nr:PQQ-dependent sugar dehydrogenase [Saprospiraceae bacterium]